MSLPVVHDVVPLLINTGCVQRKFDLAIINLNKQHNILFVRSLGP